MRPIVAAVGAALAAGLTSCGQNDELAGEVAEPATGSNEGEESGQPAKRRHRVLAHVREGRAVRLRRRPGGSVVATVGARTNFGSRRILPVVERRGRWGAVPVPGSTEGNVAWTRTDSRSVDTRRSPVTVRADVSERRLELRRGSRVVQRARVAVGAAGSPTPPGRYAVTDKLEGARFSEAAYGCCILALSGRQGRTPAGWTGGNQLAIHGGEPDAETAGCLRVRDEEIRRMMRRVPLGTPVYVER
jgi:lipoprotein-anchoring transpeptidase ErfK/SrfK